VVLSVELLVVVQLSGKFVFEVGNPCFEFDFLGLVSVGFFHESVSFVGDFIFQFILCFIGTSGQQYHFLTDF